MKRTFLNWRSSPVVSRKTDSLLAPTGIYATWLSALLLASPGLRADDMDIYTKALSSGVSGQPVLVFQVDNSGSMLWKMTSSSNSSDILDQRLYRLVDIAMAQFTGGKGTYKYGVTSYSGSNTGQLRMPAYALNTQYPAAAGTSTFNVTDEEDDAYQYGGLSAPIVYGSTISIGGGSAAVATNITTPYSSGTYAKWPINYPGSVDTKLASYGYGLAEASGSGGSSVSGPLAGIYGNVVFYYKHGSTTSDQTFKITGATQNAYLMLIDTTNDTIVEQVTTKDSSSECSSFSGNNACLTYNMQKNRTYRVVVGTDTSGVTGTFTFDLGYSSRKASSNGIQIETEPPMPNRVGLRFERVNVPRGATITNAYVEFKSNASKTWASQWRAGIDSAITPLSLRSSLFTGRTVNWGSAVAVNGWSSNETGADLRLPVTSLLQTHINQANWCGGEVVVLADGIATNGWAERSAYAYESVWSGSSAARAKLVVQWSAPGSTPAGSDCKSRVISLPVHNSADDVQQNADGTINFDTKSGSSYTRKLIVSTTKKAGLRFPLVPITSETQIVDARLEVVPESGSVQTLQIHVVDGDNMGAFEGAPGAIDALSLASGGGTDTINWTPPSWTAGTAQQSPNLASLIQSVIDRDGWDYDNTLGILLEGTASGDTAFRSWEYKDTGSDTNERARYGISAARLILTVTDDDVIPVMQTHRWQAYKMLNAFEGVTNTPIMGAYTVSSNYLMGRAPFTGQMPALSTGDCATNGIVILTDGEETGSYGSTERSAADVVSGRNPIAPDTSPSPRPAACNTDSSTNKWTCTYNMVKAMYNKVHTHSDGEKYSIRTDAIGFGPEAGSLAGLGGIEGKGGGKVYFASDSAALSAAFRDIISNMSISTASVAASGVAVNALNRFEHLDQLYYALFAPSTTIDWTGNLKRFRLKDSMVYDANEVQAVDFADTGFFSAEARSYWSDLIDGSNVSIGGAAGQTPATSRRLYTWLSSSAPANSTLVDEIIDTNSAIDATVLGLANVSGWGSMTTTQKNARRLAVIDHLRAAPVVDTTQRWGASIHGSPRVVTYDGSNTSDPGITVFYGDNRGFLHAVAAGQYSSSNVADNLANTGGEELWAFAPKSLLANAGVLHENTRKISTNGYVTGFDGDITVHREPVSGTPSKVLLFAGMRRGGRDYYALDVTKSHRGISSPSDRMPTLKWVIKGGSAGFEEMGESWSPMVKMPIRYGGTKKNVMAFGGGYHSRIFDTVGNEKHDDAYGSFDGRPFSTGAQMGRALIIVDMDTGALILNTAKLSTATYPALANMQYSVTAAPRVFDRNGDGVIDAAYVVDLAGQVFRFEFNYAATSGSNLLSSVKLVAKLGGTVLSGGASEAQRYEEGRRFYEPPSVSRVGNDLMIAISSGYREEPRSKKTKEAFFFIKDINAFKTGNTSNPVLTTSDLDDLTGTDDDETADPTKPGWFFYFDQGLGEKGVGSPLIFNFGILFSAWISQNADVACTPDIGSTRLYFIDFHGKGMVPEADIDLDGDGDVDVDLDGDGVLDGVGGVDGGDGVANRSVDIRLPGIGDTPQILYQPDGDKAVAVGVRVVDGEALGIPDGGGQGWQRSRWLQFETQDWMRP